MAGVQAGSVTMIAEDQVMLLVRGCPGFACDNQGVCSLQGTHASLCGGGGRVRGERGCGSQLDL